MQTRRHSEPSIGPVECWHATPTLFVGKHNSIKNGLLAHPPNPSPDPCGYADVVVPLVLSRCAGLAFWSLTEKQEMERTVESISQTLGAGLLEYFCTTLLDAWEDNEPISHTDFDMAHIHCTVQDIETLQAELQATEDEDEQRALEEDITGKARSSSVYFLKLTNSSSTGDPVVFSVWNSRRTERNSSNGLELHRE
ncbi:hypothetical protein EDC04DRAFT_935668 [Pisolithus marmoratus]|nr:hypothetical protein EDC04DRAFT_935668 [Pisolithus marmoratus]